MVIPSILIVSFWHEEFLSMTAFLITQVVFCLVTLFFCSTSLGILFWDFCARHNWIIITSSHVVRVGYSFFGYKLKGSAAVTTDSEVYTEPRYGRGEIIGNELYYDQLSLGMFNESQNNDLKQLRMYLLAKFELTINVNYLNIFE